MKKPVFSFYTLGCRLNQAEEESLRRQFMELGYLISKPESSDICIVNTCSVTALADKKSHQVIRSLKAHNSNLKLVVTGCGAENARNMPQIDLCISNKDKKEIVSEVISSFNVILSEARAHEAIFKKKQEPQSVEDNYPKYRTRALLKVQDGCNNFCAYCIVPFLRGREESIDADALIQEAKKLDQLGYRELVISGVNVGRYHQPLSVISSAADGARGKISQQARDDKKESGVNLVDLIKALLAETSFARIRLSSINPQDINDDMIDLWASEPRLARHFHLSLQSGSNSVLERMGRPYTAQKYLLLVNQIYKVIPEMAITTDVIVGFPGETQTEFEETLLFIKKAKLAKVHVFRYSKREGTKAARMSDQIPENVKKERAEELRDVAEKLRTNFIRRNMGSKMSVLFEEKKGNYWYGLTSNYIRIKYENKDDLYNKFQKIGLTESNIQF